MIGKRNPNPGKWNTYDDNPTRGRPPMAGQRLHDVALPSGRRRVVLAVMARARCVKMVWRAGQYRGHQCARLPMAGSTYCRQHTPEAEQARRDKSMADYEAKRKADPLRVTALALQAMREAARAVVDSYDDNGRGLDVSREAIDTLRGLL